MIANWHRSKISFIVFVVCGMTVTSYAQEREIPDQELIELDSTNWIEVSKTELLNHSFSLDEKERHWFMINSYVKLDCLEPEFACDTNKYYHVIEYRDSSCTHSVIPIEKEGEYYEKSFIPIWSAEYLLNRYSYSLLNKNIDIDINPISYLVNAKYYSEDTTKQIPIVMDSVIEVSSNEFIYVVTVGEKDAHINPHWFYTQYWLSSGRGIVKIIDHSFQGITITELSDVYILKLDVRTGKYLTFWTKSNYWDNATRVY